MGKHSILGFSTVASSWRSAYNRAQIGDPIQSIIDACGEPDECINLGDSMIMTWENSEWKGWLRGGTIVRKMTFVSKEGKIISKNGQNLDRSAG